MILRAFTIYDTKAETYMNPFFKQTKGLALREFQDAANSEDNMIGRYPTDYVLFEIGTFETSDATFSPYDAKISLGTGIEFVQEQKELWQPAGNGVASTTDSQP